MEPGRLLLGEQLTTWRGVREDHLGYKLTSIEEKVSAYWQERVKEAEAREAAEAADAAVEEDDEDES